MSKADIVTMLHLAFLRESHPSFPWEHLTIKYTKHNKYRTAKN